MKIYEYPRSFIDLFKVTRISSISNISFKPHGADQSQISWEGEAKICSNGPGRHASYMVKTFKNLLWNPFANVLESWNTAFGTCILPNLFKWWSWVPGILDYCIWHSHTTKFVQVMTLGWPLTFLRRGQLYFLCICMGKCLNGGYSETV